MRGSTYRKIDLQGEPTDIYSSQGKGCLQPSSEKLKKTQGFHHMEWRK